MEGEYLQLLLERCNDLCKLTSCRLVGFLAGSLTAGASVYYYILGEYRVSNEMLTEDISVSFPLALSADRLFFDELVLILLFLCIGSSLSSEELAWVWVLL